MTSSLPANLHERAVVRALRAFLDADDALSLVAWYLELGYAWRDLQRHREEDRRLLRDLSGIRSLWAAPFSASDLYRSIGGL